MPVTFDEYDLFCASTGREKPFDGPVGTSGWGRADRPVINLTWWDAIAYCNWFSLKAGLPLAYDHQGNLLDSSGSPTKDFSKVSGYRLPTEAEWVFTARGGHDRTGDFLFAGSNHLEEVGWNEQAAEESWL